MAEKLITTVQHYLGTNADRVAMATTEMKVSSTFEETDTSIKYKWDGTAWVDDAQKVASNYYDTAASLTRPNDIIAYAALDVVGEGVAANLVFLNAGPSGGQVIINSVSLRIDVAALPTTISTFRLHLFNAAPTAIADNAAFNLIAADRAKYLGYVDISSPIDVGDTLWSQDNGIGTIVKLADNSTTLYGVLQTIAAYTPTASVVKTVTLHNVGV